MQIRPVGAECLHADRRTDGRTELVVAFRYFANRPKNYYWSPVVNGWVSRKKILKRSYGGEHTTSH